MATGNFYSKGGEYFVVEQSEHNHDNLFYFALDSIEDRLQELGYKMEKDERFHDRIFAYSGQAYSVSKDSKLVAIIWKRYGYYAHGNLDIITDDKLVEHLLEEPYGFYIERNEDGDEVLEMDEISVDKSHGEKIRKILRSVTTEVRKVATFSNGETTYEKVENKEMA